MLVWLVGFSKCVVIKGFGDCRFIKGTQYDNNDCQHSLVYSKLYVTNCRSDQHRLASDHTLIKPLMQMK